MGGLGSRTGFAIFAVLGPYFWVFLRSFMLCLVHVYFALWAVLNMKHRVYLLGTQVEACCRMDFERQRRGDELSGDKWR